MFKRHIRFFYALHPSFSPDDRLAVYHREVKGFCDQVPDLMAPFDAHVNGNKLSGLFDLDLNG